jgi:uncharacterized protein YjeT (DUF2065 family)
MIHCYYTKETLDRVAKSGRYRAIGCGVVLVGVPVFLMIRSLIDEINQNGFVLSDNVLFLSGIIIVWIGGWSFFHRLHCNIEKTTLEHAEDEITLDDNEIRLVKVDGTQITLPREGLKVIPISYYVAGNMSFKIWNPKISQDEIVLTSDMENVKELVETIQPGTWYEGE